MLPHSQFPIWLNIRLGEKAVRDMRYCKRVLDAMRDADLEESGQSLRSDMGYQDILEVALVSLTEHLRLTLRAE